MEQAESASSLFELRAFVSLSHSSPGMGGMSWLVFFFTESSSIQAPSMEIATSSEGIKGSEMQSHYRANCRPNVKTKREEKGGGEEGKAVLAAGRALPSPSVKGFHLFWLRACISCPRVAVPAARLYRGGLKGLYVLLRRTHAGPSRAIMQEQEDNSRKHEQPFSESL